MSENPFIKADLHTAACYSTTVSMLTTASQWSGAVLNTVNHICLISISSALIRHSTLVRIEGNVNEDMIGVQRQEMGWLHSHPSM